MLTREIAPEPLARAPAGGLRLLNLRKGYNLPRYNAHNALGDPLATAELYAVQIAERQGKGPLPLKDLLRRLS